MALYLIGRLLVSARNGHHAQELADSDASPRRIKEDMPHGVVGAVDTPGEEAVEQGEAREVDITSLSDRGVRRFRNLDTGTERTEPR
jgi:hypothetical protein